MYHSLSFFCKTPIRKRITTFTSYLFRDYVSLFFLAPWIIESKSLVQRELSNISISNNDKFVEKVEVMLEQEKLPYSVDVNKSRERFKEIRNINVVVVNKTTNEEIKKKDVDKLLGLTYGKDVRLKIFENSNERLLIDFVINIDKSVSYCEPYEICEYLGKDIK